MGKENKRYYWLKFQEDFFSSLRVKKLRKLGADYLIIYLEMQLFSLQTGGYMEYKGIEDTFAQELALELDEDADKVQITLAFLQSCGLLECTNPDEYFLPYVEINTGSETASTIRSRQCRDNKKKKKTLQCNTNATLPQHDKSVAMQHQCNTDIRDKNIDKKSISKDIPEKDFLSETSSDDNIINQIVDAYNKTCTKMPKVQKITPARKQKVKQRLKTHTLEDIKKAFIIANNSNFLSGQNNNGWKANFDWFMKNDENITKVLEGNYSNKASPNQFKNFSQRETNIKELEEVLFNKSG